MRLVRKRGSISTSSMSKMKVPITTIEVSSMVMLTARYSFISQGRRKAHTVYVEAIGGALMR